jgi:hypothetical protein
MESKKKVCYTLRKEVIDIIEKRYISENMSKSDYLSKCIEYGYEMMEEEACVTEPLDYSIKRFENTIGKTFTLPIEVINQLNYFSEKLDMKKSHLACCCVLNFEYETKEKYMTEIDKFNQAAKDLFIDMVRIKHGY